MQTIDIWEGGKLAFFRQNLSLLSYFMRDITSRTDVAFQFVCQDLSAHKNEMYQVNSFFDFCLDFEH
jgi:hypothetical protein